MSKYRHAAASRVEHVEQWARQHPFLAGMIAPLVPSTCSSVVHGAVHALHLLALALGWMR